jgi:hypothetical protein
MIGVRRPPLVAVDGRRRRPLGLCCNYKLPTKLIHVY